MISDGVETVLLTVLLRSTNATTSHNVSGNCWNVDSCPAGEKCWVRMNKQLVCRLYCSYAYYAGVGLPKGAVCFGK